jgi:hypothetical protein
MMKRTDWNAENVGLELDQKIVLGYSTIDTKRRHMSTNTAAVEYLFNILNKRPVPLIFL